MLSMDGLESQINPTNSSLVAQLKISEASDKTWSVRETERLSTFGTNNSMLLLFKKACKIIIFVKRMLPAEKKKQSIWYQG